MVANTLDPDTYVARATPQLLKENRLSGPSEQALAEK